MYVANIRLSAHDGSRIPAGMHFPKDALVPHTFNCMVERGSVVEVVPGVPIESPIKRKSNTTLTVGLENRTPDAAINPPAGARSVVDRIYQQQADAAEEIKVAAVPVPVKAGNPDAKNLTPKTTISGLNQTQVDEKVAVAKTWNCNPIDLKDKNLFQLLDIYRKMCDVLNVQMDQYTDRNLLILKLSSEFNR